MMQAVSRFWPAADNLTRGAVLLAGAAATVNLGTYVGLSSSGASGWSYLLHLSIMVLGLVVFLRTGAHLWRTVMGRRAQPVAWDRRLVLCTAVSIAYLAFLTAVQLSSWGEGGAIERDGRLFWQRNGSIIRELSESEYRRYATEFLRLFSAGWLFFSLALATWNHNFLHRRRAAARRPG
jgi:hypothetical protein